jgi:predicted RNase H-like HicB family nuclease
MIGCADETMNNPPPQGGRFTSCLPDAIIKSMSATVQLTVRFEDAGEGWVMASIPEVPGAIGQGRTRAEARENVIDALRVVLTPDDQLAGGDLGPDAEPLQLTVS